MAEKLPMLALSPTMDQGTIARWHVQEGESFGEDDVLCEVETDKASMDYESRDAGTLLKILVPEGGEAEVGQPIAIFGDEGEEIDDLVQEARAELEGGGGDKGGESEAEGTAEKKRAEAGRDKKAARKKEKARKQKAKETPQEALKPQRPGRGPNGKVRATPMAKRIAREHDLDLDSVEGSGPGGRVIQADVEEAVERGTGKRAARAAAPAGAGPEDEVVRLSEMRRTIADRMQQSMQQAPHYALRVTPRVDALMASRKRLNDERGESLSFNAYLLKLTAMALAAHPKVNAAWEGDAIRRFGSVDIGVAVALEDGLVTPVVRDCARKGVAAIDAELRDLVERARSGQLDEDEYTGATFTITNLGMYGIEEFTAVINPPASAILAVGKAAKTPVVGDDGELAAATTMTLTLMCDHRAVDGAVGAEFLEDLRASLQEPLRALI
jgi:pyruvate dehydrogenase E2 component (dihydrolipoamide acetyltransferase)